MFCYVKTSFGLSLNFLSFPKIVDFLKDLLTFTGVNWLQEVHCICYEKFDLCQARFLKTSFDLCEGSSKE